MNHFSIIEGDELPFRVAIDNLRGSGITPVGAICAALSVGGKIPSRMRDPKTVAAYLFWNYEANPAWVELITALQQNQFPEETP